jgi:CHAT domain-containing protein
MQKTLLCFLLSLFLFFCFSQGDQRSTWPEQIKNYKTAGHLYELAQEQSSASLTNESLESKADSNFLQSLSLFNVLIPELRHSSNDSLLFFSLLKTGYIHYYFDSLSRAKQDYLEALSLKKNLPGIPDSFRFIPCLFTGAIYYGQNEYDSAARYFKMAEETADLYKQKLSESQRLYNMSGVMYYETGNYRQARNYFEKAILLTDPADHELITNYRINIASILVKLDSLDTAKQLYEALLPSDNFNNEINHNLAIISIKEQQFPQAISFLRKINYTNNKKSIDLYYNLAAAFSALNETDSAEFYVQRAIAENIKWNGKRKNVQFGLILKYQADELTKQQLFKEAVAQYQLSVQQFVTGYNEADPNKNPDAFQGAFSYINLFNTLTAKAAAYESWYQIEKNNKLLEAALDAYRAAFNLASYVERTYDSDEARLFLGKIKHNVHSKPINVSLQLYDITRKRTYLEDAYLFDQHNKASTLALNVQQQEFRLENGKPDPLLQRETAVKTEITRMSLKAAAITDSIQLSAIVSSIRDKEIELGRIRDKLNDDPEWQERISVEKIPTVNQLQKKLDHNTALISYHLGENELLILLITDSRFEYYKLLINKTFFSMIETFKTTLHNTTGTDRYGGSVIANRLYEKLITPVYNKLIAISRLIIIPDDELHYLPFEALQNPDNNFLVERFAVQYQYSTALLDRPDKKQKEIKTLAFAPFASKGFKDSTDNFSVLPSSGEEISEINGRSVKDSLATKEYFLKNVNRYQVFHFATHAEVDNDDPSRSYIAFYPDGPNYKLYAPEISNLQLDSAQLVILSACETGAGQLVKGEGLMSLSRAFAYAGCPDIITSLWKAEDQTTAYLTRQLHYYINKNYTKDKALQQAKIDLLTNEKIDPRYKSPVYWAHLIYIGDYERTENKANWWWIAIAFIAGALVYKLIGKKKEN